MKRIDAIAFCKENGPNTFQRDKTRRGFVCPICGSGSGSSGTGCTSKDGIHWTCWRGCFGVGTNHMSADYLDIIGIMHGLTTFNDKLKVACETLGITLDPDDTHVPRIPQRASSVSRNVSEPKVDYLEYFERCASRLNGTDYLARRGIPIEIAQKFMLGFDPTWRNPKVSPNVDASPRLIVPTSRFGYMARDVRENLPDRLQPYAKSRVGELSIFGAKIAFRSFRPIFVVEGELDSLSVTTAGGVAVAIGGTGGRLELIRAIMGRKVSAPLIIALDNDSPGRIAAAKLAAELGEIGHPFLQADNIYGPLKDANDALLADRHGFSKTVSELEKAANDKFFRDMEG